MILFAFNWGKEQSPLYRRFAGNHSSFILSKSPRTLSNALTCSYIWNGCHKNWIEESPSNCSTFSIFFLFLGFFQLGGRRRCWVLCRVFGLFFWRVLNGFLKFITSTWLVVIFSTVLFSTNSSTRHQLLLEKLTKLEVY